MERKDFFKKEWSRVLKRMQKTCVINKKTGNIIISELKILEIIQPLYKEYSGKKICLADKDYTWILIMPENKHVVITVMLDDKCNVIQYYFDITFINHLEDDNSWFDDLYLDVAYLADGSIHGLDDAELDDAYWNNEISYEEYKLAYTTKLKLIKWLKIHTNKLESFLIECMKQLHNTSL